MLDNSYHWPSVGHGGLSEDLVSAISRSWCKESSAEEGWNKDNPALGQCAVTALIIQDLAGGELLRSTVGGVSHYWNRLPAGQEVDLTAVQFGPKAILDAPPVVRERDYVISFAPTVERYRVLRERLAREIELSPPSSSGIDF